MGGNGENINNDIKVLVENGLSKEIQQALDIVCVVGNNAVHPGELDSEDVAEIAISLLDLLNLIVEETISKKQRLNSLFHRLPVGAKDAIEKRNRK